VPGHHKGAAEWCGDDHMVVRAGGQCRRLGGTRGAMAPLAPSHASSKAWRTPHQHPVMASRSGARGASEHDGSGSEP
jgi:hypothetical protein